MFAGTFSFFVKRDALRIFPIEIFYEREVDSVVSIHKTDFTKKTCLFLILSIFVFMLISSPMSYASNGDATFGGKLSEVGGIIRITVAVLGAVGLGICGIKYATGDSQTAANAGKMAIMILLAVMAVMILPVVFKMGLSIGQSHAWSPP